MTQPIKKVLVFGRGAVGITLGRILAHAMPADDFAFGCDPARKEKYETHPLLVNGVQETYRYVSDPSEFGKADLVLFAGKYGALPAMMEEAAGYIDDHTILMCASNGILSEDDLHRRFPHSTVIRTIAQKMDAVYTEDAVHFTNEGELVFGPDNPGQQEVCLRLRELFDRTHFPYVLSKHIKHDQYSKLMANCGINQVCAAYGLTYGDVAKDPKWNAMYVGAMEECRQILNTYKNAGLTRQKVEDWAKAEKTWDPGAMPSMAQDVRAGRQTELTIFSGCVLPMAKHVHLDAPILTELYDRISAIDAANAQKQREKTQEEDKASA